MKIRWIAVLAVAAGLFVAPGRLPDRRSRTTELRHTT